MSNQTRTHYLAVLADLKRERNELDINIQFVERRLLLMPEAPNEQPKATAIHSQLVQFAGEQIVKLPTSTNLPTVMDLIESILVFHNRPLHANEILGELHEKGRLSATKRSVTGGMPQDARKRFKNLGRNTWALTKWENDNYRRETPSVLFDED